MRIYYTHKETEAFLRNEKEGTFCIRFPGSNPGIAALDFKYSGVVSHVSVEGGFFQDGYYFHEGDAVQKFPDLFSLVNSYSMLLQFPIGSEYFET
jgi:hypothetical protein